MPGRRVFFSFSYEEDIWRAANVRNSGKIDAVARAGWTDASIWEEAKRKGDPAIRKLIDDALNNTSVTAVLIGADTANRRWVNYEIEKSLDRGNGLFGVRIHNLKDQTGKRSKRGPVPALLQEHRVRIYDWGVGRLGTWVERAAIHAGKPCLKHKVDACISCRFSLWLAT